MDATTEKFKGLDDDWMCARGYNADEFCCDGILNGDMDAYFKSGVRVLFLLKETYGEFLQIRGGNFSSHGHRQYKPRSRIFWKMLAFRAYVITQAIQKENPSIDLFEQLHSCKDGCPLANVAYVNIKKIKGKSKSNWTDLERFARQDKDYLNAQIQFCNPNVVVTCGETQEASMYQIYNEVLCGGRLPEKLRNGFVVNMAMGHLVISCTHPSYSRSASKASKEEFVGICVRAANEFLS